MNVVGNPTNVSMKQENKTRVTNLKKKLITDVSLCLISARPCPIGLFSFKLVLIRPAYCENVNTNASESLQTSYDHYKESVADMLFLRISGACFYSSQDSENVYEHPKNVNAHLRISCDHCELAPSCIRKPIRKHIRTGVRELTRYL